MLDSTLQVMGDCPWSGFDPATIQFCEDRLCAWVVEPANAYTSLSKTLIGIVILWSCRRHRDALMTIGVAAFLQGFFGFALHATGTFWGEALDVSGMFTISGLFLAFTARRMYGWSTPSLLLFFCALLGSSVAILLAIRPSGIYVFSVQVFLWILLEIRLYRSQGPSTNYLYLKVLVITFVIAFAAWIPDITGLVCDPDNHIFNLHSVWHLLTSLAIYWFYRYQAQFRGPSSKPATVKPGEAGAEAL